MAQNLQLDRWPFHLARAAELLLPVDRVILDLVLGRRVGVRVAAGFVGLHPGTVARRVKRLFDLQFDPLLLALCLHHDQLDPGTRSIAVAIHLHRKSQTELARTIGCSQRLISRRLSAFVGWAKALDLKPDARSEVLANTPPDLIDDQRTCNGESRGPRANHRRSIVLASAN
jgi:hypothetical protein